MEIIKVEHLRKIYDSSHARNKSQITVLNDMSFSVNKGESVAIMGKSGCGKTTLLKIMGGELKPTGGNIYYAGKDIYKFNIYQMENYRRNNIGFVFQDFRLLENLTASENIILPSLLEHKTYDQVKDMLYQIGKSLNICSHFNKYPHELSGGLKQRVAIARAIINNPDVILADEPTGNLDSETAEAVMELIMNTKKELKKTLIIVTHDSKVAAYCDRHVLVEEGKIMQ